MRASIQEQKGGIGAHEVAADFERIGWGVAENSKHDLGTDLFLMARDHRLIDLGMVVGAQVKAGPSWFKEEVRDQAGEVTGWWFREPDRDHFDAWLGHQLPHIVVLHDIEKRISYWAPLTTETITFTEKGAKVFVPAENVVGPTNFERLLAVAASRTSRATWEGSAWAGAELSPSHQLRHALLVPRLVAPHPNRGTSVPPTAAQTVAMLVQIRSLNLLELREQAAIPDLDALPEDAAWDWAFAAHLRKFIQTQNPDVLEACMDPNCPPHEQAAGTVAYAAALLECGRAEEALDTLGALHSRDALDLVDHAWVQLQHARALAELGRRQEARDEALELINLVERAPGDVTAAAIAGAAANTVFAVSDWDNADIAKVISTSDTTAAWWRQQVSGWGLSAQAEDQFRAWGHGNATLVGGDEAWRYLRSASLLAGLLGDHGAWCRATKQLATHRLSDSERYDDGAVANALTTLRRSGDHKGLRLAVRRVVNDGPALAARSAASEVDPHRSTPTSAQADLQMLVEAGDLLTHDQAEEAADWATRTIMEPAAYEQRIDPDFLVRPALVDVISAVLHALDAQAQRRILEFVLDLPTQSDQGVANRLASLVRRFPSSAWTPECARRAADRADSDNWELTYALLHPAALHVPEVRQRLEAEAHEGSLNALFALGDVSNLEGGLVASLIDRLTSILEARIDGAARRRFSGGGHDIGRAVAVLNVWHPQQANWDIIYRLLASTSWGRYIAGALEVLANKAADLPEDVATRLAPLAAAIASGPDPRHPPIPGPDPRPPARHLQATLERIAGRPSASHLAILARGNPEDRRAAALLARATRDDLTLGVLMTLIGDREPRVRATAAHAITERAAAHDDRALSLLPFLVDDPGVLVPHAVATVAADHPQLSDLAELQPLRTHISARVRTAIARTTEPPKPAEPSAS